ncbi:P-loop containing nucleoside triphosphate hydrolase protein [Bimuria novae-zelandiae CBS 107.79]|uniref:P-loop containing nucleoside triphosphate hydrolase protein n=1 Tax=Bimuria novae-zelandiae CBS 107.79 TaxID=1447943 RepID=A0A6A5VCM6_9PLEO|nr:P-loop containing nucleoside triphosphate hydrolase protein [Bimuria novae-zelandiae CBS 107.79]
MLLAVVLVLGWRGSAFLNGPASLAIRFLADPSIEQVYEGAFLHRILEQIVQPPTFWNTLVEAHQAHTLSVDGTIAFAWLLVKILGSRSDDLPDVHETAKRITASESLIRSESLEVRNLGYKIKKILDNASAHGAEEGPGGRHDNDFADFRKIKILPTPDEFSSTETPFYRRADAIESKEQSQRGPLHQDNQFRLLREDLLGELRNDYQVAIGAKKGRRKVHIKRLEFVGVDGGTETRRKFCSVKLRCNGDIPQLQQFKNSKDRKSYASENKNFLKHHSLGCLINDRQIVAFASVDRDEDRLAQIPPVLQLRIADPDALKKFLTVDTPVFAYEPILQCLQNMKEMPLKEQLLELTPEANETLSGIQPTSIIQAIRQKGHQELQHIVGTTKSVKLDEAQSDSLLTGLSKKVSLIQGPPGTGKSFIGALIAKILHDHTSETILVLTYTNHALDQFLVDLQDIGIPQNNIVRLGQKFNASTKALSISEQNNTYRMGHTTYCVLQALKSECEGYHDLLMTHIAGHLNLRITNRALLEHLEFSDDSEFFDAFKIPMTDDGMAVIGNRGRLVDDLGPGVFQQVANQSPQVWGLGANARAALRSRWIKEIVEDEAFEITNMAQKYDQCREKIEKLFHEKTSHLLMQKRIIGCTTTGAAKFTDEIQKAFPGIIIVEEAGEILESHVLTALSPKTKQLVLIGDHKQLRPKVNNHSLTVEKGNGYNLDVSMFERLVLAGVPHTTLNEQHRMRPEISALVRSLTYPELQDAPNTAGRPSLRGFQDNVIFVSHNVPELNADTIADRRDEGAKASKENEHEVEMVLKCVRYLGQQGYGTDRIVVLTPYLGQLFRLVRRLGEDNDPVLNDLDSFELIRAGLMNPAGANIAKRQLRISTIDNYQGEESDIVIASLTRSNTQGDIGFMKSPQRVNVLLSRARDGLIMIGNAETFMSSHKGKDVWISLMEQLKRKGHVYDGFPVQCEQHPDRKALLATKEAFDEKCPDGGCSEPCGKMLSCNQHKCPQRCHQLQDHSKMTCRAIVKTTCDQKHTTSHHCQDKGSRTCSKCEAEARAKERKRQRDFNLDQARQARQREYAAKLAELDDEMEHQKRLVLDEAEDEDRRAVLAQKKQDLANMKNRARKAKEAASNTPNSNDVSSNSEASSQTNASANRQDSESKSTKPVTQPTPNGSASRVHVTAEDSMPDWDKSEAQDEWDWLKKHEGADIEALDALMDMIGLESVKLKFLEIKNKVDTALRQGISLSKERFGATLLGNPGTGKTTVARHYAKFLVSVGALAGDSFFETAGSALANDGVNACKAHIDKILEEGGGVFFIDEAYQLVSGNSFCGKAVLDYLLAEIENLTGKVVFVLAGYHKQMEAFFEHNPGIPSRIPVEMEFQDYTGQELQRIFCQYIKTKYKGNMKLEEGMSGLYARIVARRIGRSRGRDGFGNARDVQNCVAQITGRQAKRIQKERRQRRQPDDLLLTKEDLIGPEPSTVLQNNADWKRLQKLIGLKSVKDRVHILLDGIQENYQRELEEVPLVEYSLNQCFIGSPGTGKTSVAKLYGRILADIGLLSNGEVVTKNPADFVGDVLGASESKTKGILAATKGKVLIIDEAYMLASGAAGDPYKGAVIDTIVAEVQSTPGEDRCVLLLGYKDQMEEMFRDVNPGLARRFPMDSAFVFEDFNDGELRQILDLKLKDVGYNATDQAKKVAMETLQRARNKPNFGNAGEVDIILDRAKALHQQHLSNAKVKDRDTFEAIDFDPDFDRAERAATNLPQLFRDVIGCETLIEQFQGYQTTAANMKALGMDPREQIPFNFLFKGPPGTGKTTTAQKMGKIFYDMGFIGQAKVIECSATDLIGQYVGQTGPKVQKLLEKALGKVLFIDEAYRLAEGGFATEAMDELVDCLTKPRFSQKLVTILAGYDKDIDRLMSINPGLTSRFPESVIFPHLSSDACVELLIKVLQKKKKDAPLDISVLEKPSPSFQHHVLDRFGKLAGLSSWGNARDVKSLAKGIFGTLIKSVKPPITNLTLNEELVLQIMDFMLKERSRRNEAVGTSRFPTHMPSIPGPPQIQQQDALKAPETKTSTNTATKASTEKAPAAAPPAAVNKPQQPLPPATEPAKLDPEEPEWFKSIFNAKRDPNVSDAVWEQMERDKYAAVARERAFIQARKEKEEEEKRIEELRRAEFEALYDEERRKIEQKRIEAELERRRKEEEFIEMEKQRELEKRRQTKIRKMGPCPAGYQWTRQAAGYRCSGGSHYITEDQVDAYCVE